MIDSLIPSPSNPSCRANAHTSPGRTHMKEFKQQEHASEDIEARLEELAPLIEKVIRKWRGSTDSEFAGDLRQESPPDSARPGNRSRSAGNAPFDRWHA